jgi:hypothetical protein
LSVGFKSGYVFTKPEIACQNLSLRVNLLIFCSHVILHSVRVSLFINSKSVCPFIYLSFHLSVHPLVCQFICLFIRLFVDLSVCPSICLSIHLSVHPFVCLFICLLIHLFVNLSVCPSLYVHSSIQLSKFISFVCTSMNLPICVCLFCLSVRQMLVRPCICLSVCHFFSLYNPLSVTLAVYLCVACVCLSAHVFVCPSIMPFHPSVYLSNCIYICQNIILSICLSVFLCIF